MNALELASVSKRYGTTLALDRISLAMPAGSRTAIVGHSGSGKTTLLRLIAGFEKPDAGTLSVNGKHVADSQQALPPHRRGIGFVPQDGALFPHLTVAGNVGFGLPKASSQRDERIAALLEMVDLPLAMLGRYPHALSGGQQQRVALARALAQRPAIMLLDEPFSALDTGLRSATRQAVAALLAAEKITAILVTHDQAEALSFADQVAVLDGGKLVQSGPPIDLYLRPHNPDIAAFLGDCMVLPAMLGEGWADCVLGRIAIGGAARSGPGSVMLRPEQIVLMPAGSQARPHLPEQILCQGMVLRRDFDGASCTLEIRIDAPAAAAVAPVERAATGSTLLVRCPVMLAPEAGTTVQLSLIGPAHAFDVITHPSRPIHPGD